MSDPHSATLAAIARRVWRLRSRPRRPPVSTWLDTNRVIGRNYPSPFPGPWRTSRTPYLREPLDAFDDPTVETIVLKFSSQIAKTEAVLGMLLYSYAEDPGSALYVMPTLDDVEGFSKERLVLALKTCPSLRVGDQKARNSDNAVRNKRINGFPLTLVGSNSTSGLASRPARRVFCDEIDKFETTAEGDPIKQAFQRTAAFRRRKQVLASTPTLKGASRIEDFYARGDQRVLEVQCPECRRWFEVRWHHVVFDAAEGRTNEERARTAYLEHHEDRDEDGNPVPGTGCGRRIEDRERPALYARARWRATAPASKIRSYRAWAVACPWISLASLVEEWLDAQGNPEKLQTFVNLKLGEPWELPSEKVEANALLIRREAYTAEVPARATVLTAGVDTQDDRLEALVVAWGRDEESWVVRRETAWGDPQLPSTWKELDDLLLRPYPHEAGGAVRVQAVLVDALGHRTSAVYVAVAARAPRRWFASVGTAGERGQPLVSQPKIVEAKEGNVPRVVVDASQAKALLYSRLRLTGEDGLPMTEGPGVVHFPMTVGAEFFDQLTAEHLITVVDKYGNGRAVWAKRPGRTRNESLDCFGLALAALRLVAPTSARFAELAAKIAAARGAEKPAAPAGPRPPRVPRTEGAVVG